MKAKKAAKARAAIRRYIELVGMEVIEDGWAHGGDSVDFVARDEGGELVFVTAGVSENAGAGVPGAAPSRKAFERVAAAYLAEHDAEQCFVRCDAVDLLVLNGERGLIRHWRNALSQP